VGHPARLRRAVVALQERPAQRVAQLQRRAQAAGVGLP